VKVRLRVIALLAVAMLGCQAETPAGGVPEPAPAGPIAGAAPAAAPLIDAPEAPDAPLRVLDPRADAILRAMSTLLAATTQFALEAEESFDEIPGGQPRILFTNLRRIAVARPDRFAADAEGDSINRSVWYDGRAVSALDKATRSYATIQAPDSIDAALDMLGEKYGLDVPLADLFYADPYAALTEAVTYSRYLGLHRAAGIQCHHLVFAQPTIEWQIWIDAGERPLPRKMAITYVREPGEPQYVATITKWKLAPALPDTLFRFEAPGDAERVDAAAMALRLPGGAR
jgi:hypothetical protein